MIAITLTHEEMLEAIRVGKLRRDESAKIKLKNRRTDDYTIDIVGACGEYAAAKALGIPWRGDVNTFHDPDVGKLIQVRTAMRDRHKLIIRKQDNPEHIFVMVVHYGHENHVIGWIRGKEGIKPEFVNTENPDVYDQSWFIPQNVLHPIETLPKEYL